MTRIQHLSFISLKKCPINDKNKVWKTEYGDFYNMTSKTAVYDVKRG